MAQWWLGGSVVARLFQACKQRRRLRRETLRVVKVGGDADDGAFDGVGQIDLRLLEKCSDELRCGVDGRDGAAEGWAGEEDLTRGLGHRMGHLPNKESATRFSAQRAQHPSRIRARQLASVRQVGAK